MVLKYRDQRKIKLQLNGFFVQFFRHQKSTVKLSLQSFWRGHKDSKYII